MTHEVAAFNPVVLGAPAEINRSCIVTLVGTEGRGNDPVFRSILEHDSPCTATLVVGKLAFTDRHPFHHPDIYRSSRMLIIRGIKIFKKSRFFDGDVS